MYSKAYGEKKPREKAIKYGIESLQDDELIAIMIGTGCKNMSVYSLAEKIIKVIDKKREQISFSEIKKLNGIGQAKALLLLAVIEFSRRYNGLVKKKIRKPIDIFQMLAHYGNRDQECFFAVSLNANHEVINSRLVSIGLVNKTMVHPREVFAGAITDRAFSLIVAHNHPSGNVEPSADDIEVTHTLKKAGKILGINLLDHVIFTSYAYYSYTEEHKIKIV